MTDQHNVISNFIQFIGDERLEVHLSEDPIRSARRSRGRGIALLEEGYSADAYLIEHINDSWQILGDSLGLQYGLAHVLEAMDYRFYHPYQSYLPDELDEPELSDVIGELQTPQMIRRGLHLHTLHPIEGYYDFWEPGEENLERSKRVIDWLIKNRGNYIEWVALDNIIENPIALEAWQEHTSMIVDNIHERGLTTGIGVQLFGSGNLQNAFDLIDDPNIDPEAQIIERMELIANTADFDVIEMSFGEFFEEDPQNFIDMINDTYAVILGLLPDVEMTSRLHVGADLEITYDGQDMIYYFLAAYAAPEITPWVHTVMYYNLFEEANGAYHHEDFTEHREFLLERLRKDQTVAYFPESAYWVAFDNSVPSYLPLYIRSRWLDMYEIQQWAVENEAAMLTDHILFSSGWEWGYWQNDVATLRMNWRTPDDYRTVLEEMFGNYENGQKLADSVYQLAEIQRFWLIEEGLSAYNCGVDSIMELGYTQEIISQPVRPSFSDMMLLSSEELQEQMLTPLSEFLQDIIEIQQGLPDALDLWQEEIHHGVQIDLYRTHFMLLLIEAIQHTVNEEDPHSSLAEAQQVLDNAQQLVQTRHQNSWDDRIERLLGENSNASIYQFGYLYRAEELCYWNREYIQVRNVILDASEFIPGCGL